MRRKLVVKVDRIGREFFICQKCGKRLKHIESRGKLKLICNRCFKKVHHAPIPNSSFIKKTLKKGRKKLEVVLEITEHNRNWHYLDGSPVLGFKNAIKYYRAKVHRLTHKEDYKEIDYGNKKV